MSAEAEKVAAKPRRRWFQFSLGSSLLVMTVFGLWFGNRMDRARRQERAVAALHERGDVIYESRFSAPSLDTRFKKTAPYAPKWLRAVVGDDCFDRVRTVHLDESPTNYDLRYLEDLPDIESLVISGPDVSDDGLQHLQYLHSLKELVLESPKISDAGLVHLHSLQELRVLAVYCAVTQKGALALLPLRKLERLDVRVVGVNPASSRNACVLDDRTQFDFNEEPLISVVDFLCDYHGIKILIDREALQAAGVRTDFPITAKVSSERLETALNATFKSTSIGWMLTPSGIVITTEEKASAKLAGVRELKKRLPNLKKVVCVVDP